MNWNPTYSYAILPPDFMNVPTYYKVLAMPVSPQQGLPHFRNVHIWNIKATGATTAFNVSAYANAPLEHFRFDHLDIDAKSAGSIANAKNWSITDSTIRTADGSKPVFNDSITNSSVDVPFGEPVTQP